MYEGHLPMVSLWDRKCDRSIIDTRIIIARITCNLIRYSICRNNFTDQAKSPSCYLRLCKDRHEPICLGIDVGG